MDAKNCYAKQVLKERMRIRDDISSVLKPQALELVHLQIVDEGYVVDAVPIASKNGNVSFGELCRRVDKLEFEKYIIVDISFSMRAVNMVLVPTTEETMNDFVWNYIMCHFPFNNELEALSLAIGVLERMVEPLSKEIKSEYEKFITITIQ